jgi:hypothetical protein
MIGSRTRLSALVDRTMVVMMTTMVMTMDLDIVVIETKNDVEVMTAAANEDSNVDIIIDDDIIDIRERAREREIRDQRSDINGISVRSS